MRILEFCDNFGDFFNILENFGKSWENMGYNFQSRRQTRPSKQCKSLIWILILVFPVLIYKESKDCNNCGKYSIILETFHLTGNALNYHCTSTSMFIGHFALTPETLVRLSWNFVLRILHTIDRSGANFSPIQQKAFCHPEDRPLCKWPFAK